MHDLRGCVYVFSERVSTRAYCCNTPCIPWDVLPWLPWWWRPILGIRVVACFATAMKTSMLSRSHGPHLWLQQVTWPLSLSTPRRAIERVVSPGRTVESRYCFEWKQRIWGVRGQISYSRSVGNRSSDKRNPVSLSHTHTHNFSSYTASSKNKAALRLSTLC